MLIPFLVDSFILILVVNFKKLSYLFAYYENIEAQNCGIIAAYKEKILVTEELSKTMVIQDIQLMNIKKLRLSDYQII